MNGKICLIVDDEPTIRILLKVMLEEEQFKVLEAETAAAAFQTLKKRRGAVDLLVTDIIMPGVMDGLDLAAAVRKEFPLTGVLVMTGLALSELNSRFGGVVDFEFIRKPFDPAALLGAVRRAMRNREKSPHRAA